MMRFHILKFDMRVTMLFGAAFAIGVALIILLLGYRHDREVDRLVAEGAVAQGRYVSRDYGSCRNRDCSSDRLNIQYTVDGRDLVAVMAIRGSNQSEPIFEPERIRIPRLGPERPYQVVYLPSEPETARVRDDMTRGGVGVYFAASFFLLIGTVFAAVALFLLPNRRRAALRER